jgi:hypothetical protein
MESATQDGVTIVVSLEPQMHERHIVAVIQFAQILSYQALLDFVSFKVSVITTQMKQRLAL